MNTNTNPILRAFAEGRIQHLNRGQCPDMVSVHDSRDPDCPVCAALSTAAEQPCDSITDLRTKQSAPATQQALVFDEQGFRDWVLRNLPDDTIIGSSAWWADHLTTWAQRFMTAAPQQEVQEPLTPEQISAMSRKHPAEDLCGWSYRMGIADAEDAHGINGDGVKA